MCDKLAFLCIYCQASLGEFPLYIFNHATHNKYEMHESQTLKNKPILIIKPFPLNPLNFSPIDNKYQNGWRNLETNMG
jgi:hypothetical protein